MIHLYENDLPILAPSGASTCILIPTASTTSQMTGPRHLELVLLTETSSETCCIDATSSVRNWGSRSGQILLIARCSSEMVVTSNGSKRHEGHGPPALQTSKRLACTNIHPALAILVLFASNGTKLAIWTLAGSSCEAYA